MKICLLEALLFPLAITREESGKYAEERPLTTSGLALFPDNLFPNQVVFINTNERSTKSFHLKNTSAERNVIKYRYKFEKPLGNIIRNSIK